MLDFYYLATPHGQRLLTFLEETGLPYKRLPQPATLALAGQWLAVSNSGAGRANGHGPELISALDGVLP